MATYDTTRTSALSLEISAGISRAISAVLNGISDLRAAHRTRIALSSLTDVQLDDIGLCRADIRTRF